MTIQILLVDDEPMLRLGLGMVLGSQTDMNIVGEAGSGDEAVRLAALHQPDVVLMDVRMPGSDGIGATARLAAAGSPVRVLILTTFDLDEYAYAALRAGASGFLLKNVPPDDLIAAVRAVARGEAVVSPRITRQLLSKFSHQLPRNGVKTEHGLTPRELEVVLLISAGLANAEIAAALVVAETTIKTHVGRILTKLDLRDRVQIVIYAYEHGLLERS